MKLQLKLLGDQRERIEAWIGPPTTKHLRRALRQRFGLSLPIAVLYVISSLPIAGDSPADSLPFDPINLGLGLVLVGLWAHARFHPRPYLFLLDATWFLLFQTKIVIDILAGHNSYWWLLWTPLALFAVIAGIRQFIKFRRVDHQGAGL